MNPTVIILFASILFVQDLYGSDKPDSASVINPDGTLNLHTGFSGSLDLSNSQVRLDPEIGPVLSPTMLTPDWYPLGPGLNGAVFCIAISGNDVYAGGDFQDAGGDLDADNLARWDGCEWHAVGPGLNNTVWAIEFNGGNIYIGGGFTAPFDHIGYWDGVQWNAMGSGLNNNVFTLSSSGNDIYAGGQFTDAGGNANGDYVAKWNGSSWLNLGSGLNDFVWDMEGNGNDVYVGGRFLNAGGNPDADFIARWDGTSWNNLGPAFVGPIGINRVELDGTNVYVNVLYADGIAYWDGNIWHSLSHSWVDAMFIYGNNMYVSTPTSDCAYLERYDLNGQYWDELPGGCFYTYVYAFAYNGIDLYAGGDFFYNSAGCPNCNIMRYGEPDNIPPLELNIPTEICQDDIPITLSTTQSGYTGEWSGDGVTNNVFDPSGLLGEITLTFTPDPGQCVLTATGIILVIDCAPPPCPSAGQDITVSGCPTDLTPQNILDYLNADPGGTWDPPLNGYGACITAEGPYTYTQDNPGCPIEQATITFDWTWDPCGWELEGLCLTGDEGSFTIPAFEGDHPGSTYTVYSNCVTIMPTTGSLDESTDFTFTWDSWCSTTGCINIWIIINEDPSCEYYFGEQEPTSGGWFLCDLPLCNCVDPPYAGEDVSISICDDNAPFDLTEVLGGNPDADGTWSPPLSSGGNIYDPAIDGSGIFTYTVSSSGCADDQATVTVTVQSIAPAVISGIPSTVCETASPIVLPTIQNGITGDWSGIGVTNNIFNPAGLNGSITITFTPGPNQCTNPASTTIDVYPFVIISITGIPDSVCQSAPSVSLPTIQTGITGNWSGIGVVNNIFNPNGLSGNILFAFTPNANECADPASTTIYVSAAITPLISGIPDSLCQTDPSVNLPTTQSGITGN